MVEILLDILCIFAESLFEFIFQLCLGFPLWMYGVISDVYTRTFTRQREPDYW